MSGAPTEAPAVLTCAECGEVALPGERFCESCGAPLPGAGDTDPSPANDAAPGSDPPAAAAATCASCGGRIAADGYCGTCGAPAVRERDHWVERPVDWVAAVCDRGIRHHRNEDAVALAAETGGGFAALVVCDGVSSARDSDVASLAAARAARDVLTSGIGERPSLAGRISGWTERLTQAAAAANAAAIAAGEAAAATGDATRDLPPNRFGWISPPSCTFVAAVVDGPVIVAGAVGDSRAYWLPDDGPAEQLTVDDSWAAEQVAAGMPREVAEAAPEGHAITRWLGADSPDHEPRCAATTPGSPGWLLVCSDGLWNYCSAAPDMARLVAGVAGVAGENGPDPARVAAGLVDWANAQGGQDNITVALARVQGRTGD